MRPVWPCRELDREYGDGVVALVRWSIVRVAMCVYLYIYIQFMIDSVQGSCSFIG
jgi:hypothetical protein